MNLGNVNLNTNTISFIFNTKIIYKEHDTKLKYHNSTHIFDCLMKFINTNYLYKIDENKHNGFITSIIFHDCVYNPISYTNEKDSIDRFYKLIPSKMYKNNEEYDEYIPSIIQSTAFGENHDTIDKQVMHDIDYSGFASERKVFEENMNNIYSEYKPFLTKYQYVERKVKFLKEIQKKKIFYFDDVFDEDLAKENIKYELNYLKTWT